MFDIQAWTYEDNERHRDRLRQSVSFYDARRPCRLKSQILAIPGQSEARALNFGRAKRQIISVHSTCPAIGTTIRRIIRSDECLANQQKRNNVDQQSFVSLFAESARARASFALDY